MKALQLTHFGSGESNLKIVEKEIPEPGPQEVLVRVHYSPLNPSDIFNTLQGTYQKALSNAIWNVGRKKDLSFDPKGQKKLPIPPFTPGYEGMGVVEKTGSSLLARRLKGKRVALAGSGNWAEYNVLPATQVFPLPKALSDVEGAMCMINPLTAYAMVVRVLAVPQGHWLLQSAANSELGKMVIKLGKKMGFHTINIVRHAEQVNPLKDLGANHVLVWGKDNLRESVHTITLGRGVPYALDAVAGKIGSEMTYCLSPGAKMLVYGTLSNEMLRFSSRNLMTPAASIQGFFLSHFMGTLSKMQKYFLLKKVMQLVQEGTFRSEVEKLYPLHEFKAAIRHAKRPGHKGKILLDLQAH